MRCFFWHTAANLDIKVTNKKRIQLARDRNYFGLVGWDREQFIVENRGKLTCEDG